MLATENIRISVVFSSEPNAPLMDPRPLNLTLCIQVDILV